MTVKLNQADIVQTDGTVVLENIYLAVGPGEFVYLVGKTGSGKTSLLKTLYGALALRAGDGEVAGYPLAQLKTHDVPYLRRKLGIVFQDFNLLTDRNVEENLRFVLEATGWTDALLMQQRIEEVIQEVGLLHKLKEMPYMLSGGEQQRVVLARAMLNKPILLLADEPTGNLDPETSDDILILLRNLAKNHNTAVICATHDYRIMQNFPARVIRVQKGKLVEE
jgi:cell division transport system ATP-binding protein